MMLTLFVGLSLVYIAAHALFAINRMTQDTCSLMRATFILISIGAASGVMELLDGHIASFSDAILIGGLVLYFVGNKRRSQCK